MKNKKLKLPITLILVGFLIGLVGALLKILEFDFTSIILLASLILGFFGITLLLIRVIKE